MEQLKEKKISFTERFVYHTRDVRKKKRKQMIWKIFIIIFVDIHKIALKMCRNINETFLAFLRGDQRRNGRFFIDARWPMRRKEKLK